MRYMNLFHCETAIPSCLFDRPSVEACAVYHLDCTRRTIDSELRITRTVVGVALVPWGGQT